MSGSEFTRALIAFVEGPLCARHGAARPSTPIDATTELFATGIVDSLGIIDLLSFVERETGRPIPMRKVDMKYFATIERISESFWHAEAGRS